MSIRYLTTCDNCKVPYSFETGSAYSLFFNDGFHKSWISSFGNKSYRAKLSEFLNKNKDFFSPIDVRLYGCPKCHLIYNIEILENFISNFEFHCKKCKKPLICLNLKIVTKKGSEYIYFYDSNNTKFIGTCENCKKELLGLVDGVMYID